LGRRLSGKRSDKRWEDENGVWASKLEALIFAAIKRDPRVVVRRCSEGDGDTFAYTTLIRSGLCASCGDRDVVQERTYTPDLCLVPAGVVGEAPRRYLEIKGYFPGPKRSLLRGFLKTGPRLDLRLILERDTKATSSMTLLEYCHKFFKIPIHVWDGRIPEAWYTWTDK
jgi:hypothetical protein